MTLTIQLPDDRTVALSVKAQAKGLTPEEYARQVIEQDLAPEWLQESWRDAKASGLDQLTADEIDAEIAAARRDRRNH